MTEFSNQRREKSTFQKREQHVQNSKVVKDISMLGQEVQGKNMERRRVGCSLGSDAEVILLIV